MSIPTPYHTDEGHQIYLDSISIAEFPTSFHVMANRFRIGGLARMLNGWEYSTTKGREDGWFLAEVVIAWYE